jgi:hypothetical protein
LIVVLWEHEIIEAAKALEKMTLDKPTAEDAKNAMKACFAAIYSPELAGGKFQVTVMSAKRIEPSPVAEVPNV